MGQGRMEERREEGIEGGIERSREKDREKGSLGRLSQRIAAGKQAGEGMARMEGLE